VTQQPRPAVISSNDFSCPTQISSNSQGTMVTQQNFPPEISTNQLTSPLKLSFHHSADPTHLCQHKKESFLSAINNSLITICNIQNNLNYELEKVKGILRDIQNSSSQ
jgi:hypothetical protein